MLWSQIVQTQWLWSLPLQNWSGNVILPSALHPYFVSLIFQFSCASSTALSVNSSPCLNLPASISIASNQNLSITAQVQSDVLSTEPQIVSNFSIISLVHQEGLNSPILVQPLPMTIGGLTASFPIRLADPQPWATENTRGISEEGALLSRTPHKPQGEKASSPLPPVRSNSRWRLEVGWDWSSKISPLQSWCTCAEHGRVGSGYAR